MRSRLVLVIAGFAAIALLPGALGYVPAEPPGGATAVDDNTECGSQTCGRARVAIDESGYTYYYNSHWTTNPNWYSHWHTDERSLCTICASAWTKTTVRIGQFYDATVPCCTDAVAYAAANQPGDM